MTAPTRTFTVPHSDGRLRRDATEQRILDATTKLLDGGASLAGLSVARIVEAAGVSRATFYLHFSDKRELVARLAETELASFDLVTSDFFETPDADREALAAAADKLVVLWRAHAGVLSSLIELAEYDPDSQTTWQSVIDSIAARIATVLQERRPELSANQCETLAQIIAWAGERSCHQMIGRESTAAQARRVAAGLTEAIWRIITPAR